MEKGLRPLVDRSGRRVGAQQHDHPLDLTPAAEMNDIAERAAVRRAVRGLVGGVDAEPRDQFGGIGRRRAVRQVNVAGQRFPLDSAIRGTGLTGAPFQSAQRQCSTAR